MVIILVSGASCNCFSGRPSFDGKPEFSFGPISQKDRLYRKSFAGLESIEDEDPIEIEDDVFANLNERLLAIGTLGLDPVAPDESQLEAHFDIQDLPEKESELTPTHIKLINEELEKVLNHHAKEEAQGHAPAPAPPQAQGQVLINHHPNNNAKDSGVENQGQYGNVCPLQGYLFGSPVNIGAVRVKEQRTSLGELFMRSKAEDVMREKEEREEKKEGNSNDNNNTKVGAHLVRKILGRKSAHRNTSSNANADSSIDPAANKLHKLLHIFHRKIHPESSDAAKNETKAHLKGYKGGGAYDGDVDEGKDLMGRERESARTRRYKAHRETPFSGINSNGNTGYWIKTDANYLVLEL
ncbi:protein LAZY 1 [Amborella trichopoda]|uniref:protein LAZY 1 n=1 Tax=Amborella trichopoda TaxID=13333 RepID=UPI0009BCB3C7|nr:protein LAZY 1 [Amborella trichopoda]|eukprot:XP_020525381.1 protein LAZY 1 [Amborella trichopoda]